MVLGHRMRRGGQLAEDLAALPIGLRAAPASGPLFSSHTSHIIESMFNLPEYACARLLVSSLVTCGVCVAFHRSVFHLLVFTDFRLSYVPLPADLHSHSPNHPFFSSVLRQLHDVSC